MHVRLGSLSSARRFPTILCLVRLPAPANPARAAVFCAVLTVAAVLADAARGRALASGGCPAYARSPEGLQLLNLLFRYGFPGLERDDGEAAYIYSVKYDMRGYLCYSFSRYRSALLGCKLKSLYCR